MRPLRWLPMVGAALVLATLVYVGLSMAPKAMKPRDAVRFEEKLPASCCQPKENGP